MQLWMREHNRLCDKLEEHRVFKRWSANRKYKHVKNTVIAKLQQIALNEWLPAFGISKRDLEKSRAKTDLSTVSVEFSVAYRLGHTLIPDVVAGFKLSDLFDAQVLFYIYSSLHFLVPLVFQCTAGIAHAPSGHVCTTWSCSWFAPLATELCCGAEARPCMLSVLMI